MSDDDWMQQLKQRKQQETGPARQQRATTTGYAVSFTLPPQEAGRSLPGQETPEFRYRGFVDRGNRGIQLYKQGRLTEALAAYDEAIRLGEALDLSLAEYRHTLANTHDNKGLALYALGTHQALVAAVAAHDQAIRLGEALDLSVAQYRNDLASAHTNKGNALQALGTPHALTEAVAAYDEAIRLRAALDLSVAEYRNELASAHNNKGTALHTLGTPQALAEAVAAYDEAIRLRETLDLSVAEYRNGLASAHNNKGIALQDLGTPQALAAAVAAYDEAIQLREALDLSVAQYRSNLADTYNGKGNALRALGTPHALVAAVAAYDEAIRLHEALDLSVAEYRNDLAGTHNNKGLVLEALGTPQALAAAVAAYDEAIRLGAALDLSVAEYRNGLAAAHNNKGNALRALGTPQDLAAAVAAYDEAIRLGEALDLSVAKYRTNLIGFYAGKGNLLSPRMALDLYQKAIALADGGRGLSTTGIEATAKAYLGAVGAYLRLADPASAADAADDGLSLLRELEIKGVFKLRSLRERLFATTLDAYVQSRRFQWVPDIIRECLDPNQPGSAPASEAMHAAAFNALIRSLTTLYQEPRRAVADTLAELKALARQLADWRVRYFSGEASSAWLRAQDFERRGLSEQAKQILLTYTEKRKDDPCGHKVLGDWYVQRHQPAEAEAAYREAARVCALSTPPRDDLYARSAHIITLARCLLDLRLLQLSDAASAAATTPDPIKTLGQGYDELHTLLTGDFVNDLVKHSPPDLKGLWWERLKPELEVLWQQRAAAQRDDWLTKHVQGMAREERDQAFEAVLTLTKGLFRGLGRSWKDCQQAVSGALKEIWDYGTTRQNQTDWEELAAAAVREAVERAARALADSELDAAYEHLRQTLNPLWDRAFEDREKRFLGCGWRSLQHLEDEDLRRFAGLNLGLAVEWSLAQHVYEPLKAYWSQRGKPDLGTHQLAPQIDRFLTRPNQHLMLGQMVGALNSALKHAHDAPPDLEKPDKKLAAFIAGFLRQKMPNPNPLLVADERAGAHRRHQLDLINRHRIDCAHPESPPSQEQLQTLWGMVAADPEHAFFRYFGAALLPPPDRVTST